MANIDKGIVDQLVRSLAPPKVEHVPEGSRIRVHAAVSRFAVLYERIRNAVEYKDEHVLRKSAIIRILKRQLILETNAQAISGHLIRELIGARYIPNEELPESLIQEVAIRVSKYLAIARCRVGSGRHLAWLRDVLAVEIEELLVDNTRDKALTTFLYERLGDRIRLRGSNMDASDLRLQVYIAVYRTLIKADDDTLSFKLLRAYLPEWLRPEGWVEDPQATAERLIGIEQRIKRTLTNPTAPRIQRAVRPWAVSLNILKEVLLEKPNETRELLEKPEALKDTIGRIVDRQYRESQTKIRRGALRAIIYIFLTKMLIAFAFEVPLEQLIYHTVSVPVLCVNLLFPPILMCVVALFIRVPGKENTQRLKSNVLALLSTEGVPERELKIPAPRGFLANALLSGAYAAIFLFIFGGLGVILLAIHFTWVSAAIFIFFLCTVSFFAFRLRQTARELVVIEDKESVRSLMLDIISLPILRAGHLLASGISRINVFLFFFDFLLEAPFKIFLTVLEEWFGFLKEKKEELQ